MTSLLQKVEQKLVSGQKLIILHECPLSQDELTALYSNNPDVCNLHKFVLEKNIVELLKYYDVLIIDLKVKENFHFWSISRGFLENTENVTTVFKRVSGSTITNVQEIKDALGADYVLKYLPDEAGDKMDYLTKISNDHISSRILTKSLFLRIVKRLWSLVFGK